LGAAKTPRRQRNLSCAIPTTGRRGTTKTDAVGHTFSNRTSSSRGPAGPEVDGPSKVGPIFRRRRPRPTYDGASAATLFFRGNSMRRWGRCNTVENERKITTGRPPSPARIFSGPNAARPVGSPYPSAPLSGEFVSGLPRRVPGLNGNPPSAGGFLSRFAGKPGGEGVLNWLLSV